MNVEDEIEQAKQQVHREVAWLYQMGLVAGSSGNVSMRVADTDLVALTPAGVQYCEITPDDIVIVDRSGEKVSGPHDPTSEVSMHLAIYEAQPGMFAVAHTHSPFATAFAVIREPIPLISNEGLGVKSVAVEVTDFELPGSAELAFEAVKLLQRSAPARAVLLANHGLVTVGLDLTTACRLAHEVELEAKVYYLARTMGEAHRLTLEQLDAITRSYLRPKAQTDRSSQSDPGDPPPA